MGFSRTQNLNNCTLDTDLTCPSLTAGAQSQTSCPQMRVNRTAGMGAVGTLGRCAPRARFRHAFEGAPS